MKILSRALLLCIFAAACGSCQKTSLPLSEYLRHIEDEGEGYRKKTMISGWTYTIQYKPYDYIIAQEQKKQLNRTAYQNRLRQLEGTAWFNISFQRDGSNNSPLRYNVSSLEEYQTRYNYYLAEAPRDIVLIHGRDTMMPMSYLFETSYNLAPQEVMVVGFDLKNVKAPNDKMQLVLFDRIFQNGIIKATYSKEQLRQIPTLKF